MSCSSVQVDGLAGEGRMTREDVARIERRRGCYLARLTHQRPGILADAIRTLCIVLVGLVRQVHGHLLQVDRGGEMRTTIEVDAGAARYRAGDAQSAAGRPRARPHT
jgi:hypothetical protein